MNKEIKEILDMLGKVANRETASRNTLMETKAEDYKLLLDYITNLQEQLHQASLDIQELIERDIECPSNCDKLTNLQEENERLEKHKEYYKNETKRLGKLFYITKEENIKLEEAQKNFEKQFIKEMDYKSRIDKAKEYIENNTLYTEDFDYDEEDNLVWQGAYDYKAREDLLNILRGDK